MNRHSFLGQSSARPSFSHNLREASQLLLATSLCGTGAVVLLPSAADAAVIATPGISPSTPLSVPYTGDGIYVNVLNGATGSTGGATPGWDFNPYGGTVLQWWSTTNVPVGALLRYSSSGDAGAGSLDLGTLVDSTGAYAVAGGPDTATAGAAAGQWKLSNANYFGFQFFDEGDSLVHYGYGIMTLGSATDASGGPRTITNIFYETVAGQGIVVGAVPEPTSSLLASGAAGLALLRRRRIAA